MCYTIIRKGKEIPNTGKDKKMKHLQKAKEVTVRVFSKNNGHFKNSYKFTCALDAKRFCERMSAEAIKPLWFIICDEQNELYRGDGMKI